LYEDPLFVVGLSCRSMGFCGAHKYHEVPDVGGIIKNESSFMFYVYVNSPVASEAYFTVLSDPRIAVELWKFLGGNLKSVGGTKSFLLRN